MNRWQLLSVLETELASTAFHEEQKAREPASWIPPDVVRPKVRRKPATGPKAEYHRAYTRDYKRRERERQIALGIIKPRQA